MAKYKFKDLEEKMKRRGIKDEIIDLRKKGKSYRQIEAILDCSRGTISYHCKKAGLDGNMSDEHHKQLSNAEVNKINEALDKNSNIYVVAKELGHCYKTVAKYKKK